MDRNNVEIMILTEEEFNSVIAERAAKDPALNPAWCGRGKTREWVEEQVNKQRGE